jgi:hypothetical protein
VQQVGGCVDYYKPFSATAAAAEMVWRAVDDVVGELILVQCALLTREISSALPRRSCLQPEYMQRVQSRLDGQAELAEHGQPRATASARATAPNAVETVQGFRAAPAGSTAAALTDAPPSAAAGGDGTSSAAQVATQLAGLPTKGARARCAECRRTFEDANEVCQDTDDLLYCRACWTQEYGADPHTPYQFQPFGELVASALAGASRSDGAVSQPSSF